MSRPAVHRGRRRPRLRPHPARPPEPLPDAAIIDLHCHTAGIGAGDSGCRVSERLRRNFKFGRYLQAFGVTEAQLERQGDALIIEVLGRRLSESRLVRQAVILALDAAVGADGREDDARTEICVPNAFVRAATARHENLAYAASVHPARRDAIERLDREVAGGCVLMKWLPAIQHMDPGDRRYTAFYERLAAHGLPLLTHTGREHSFTCAENRCGRPERLRLPLEIGVTVIAAHVATPGRGSMRRLLEMLRQYDNLYADISSLTQINKLGYLSAVLRHADILDRLSYGTDLPLAETGIVSPYFFPLNLPLREMRRLAAVGNPWDQDVLLKQALGTPAHVFARSARLLRLPAPPGSRGADGATPG